MIFKVGDFIKSSAHTYSFFEVKRVKDDLVEGTWQMQGNHFWWPTIEDSFKIGCPGEWEIYTPVGKKLIA